MRDIHCPKDIGFENTFVGEDCEKEQFYNNCYHCWTSAIAKAFQVKQEPVIERVRTEIENHCALFKENHCRYCSHCNIVMGVREILEVIDKYKVESEGEK